METENAQFIFALVAAARSVERRLDGALSSVKGISLSEYLLLKALQEFDGSAATRVELAKAVQLTPSAVTRALKPLEKIGYVTTEKGERDARQSIASLTRAGKKLLQDASALVRDEAATLPLPSSQGPKLTEILQNLASRNR